MSNDTTLDNLGSVLNQPQSANGTDGSGKSSEAKTPGGSISQTEAPAGARTEEEEIPWFIESLPPLFADLWREGIEFQLDSKGNLSMTGFYKHGPMQVDVVRGKGAGNAGSQTYTVDKRGRRTSFSTIDELARINFEWWRQANSRKNQYVVPDRPWADLFAKNGWVKRQVIYVPVDNSPSGGASP